jgi:hypothetical protein
VTLDRQRLLYHHVIQYNTMPTANFPGWPLCVNVPAKKNLAVTPHYAGPLQVSALFDQSMAQKLSPAAVR